MFAGIDATGKGLPPRRDHSPTSSLFFVVWIILGSLLLLNLFVGVLVRRGRG